jgi:hypothetical protein
MRKNIRIPFFNTFKTVFCAGTQKLSELCITTRECIGLSGLVTGCYSNLCAVFGLARIYRPSAFIADVHNRYVYNYMIINSIYGASNACCRDVALF